MPAGIIFESGPGDTIERAVLIRGAANHMAGVAAEYQYLDERFGERGVDWNLETQVRLEVGDRSYDELHVKLSDGTKQKIIFDVSEFLGKW